MSAACRVRNITLTAVAVLAATACTSGAGSARSAEGGGASRSVVLEPVQASARESHPSALELALDDPRLPAPLVEPSRVVSGGPPPDGIPPIDEPRFVRPDAATWLADEEPVVSLTVGRRHRAYPVQILVWHEIVNDTVDGTPVVVTYCPLCNSALAFDRRLGERLLSFGTSGRLYLSDLVMYDRQTESLWSQIEGRAIAGFLTGADLDRVPVQTVAWRQWHEAHPDGWVLSRDTGAVRDYGSNPYPDYDDEGSDPFLFDGRADPRLAPKSRVLALGDRVDPVAVPLSLVSRQRVLEVDVAGSPVVLWAVDGLRSALDSVDIAEGRRIAASGAFDPEVDGRRLTFAADGPDSFVDRETRTVWDVLGRAVQGPMTGARLEPVEHIDTFWFAWAAFHPDTRLVTAAG